VKGRVQLSGFAAVMFLYCLPFAWGFLNFEMALGVALVGIAAMFAIEERPWALRLAVHSLFVVGRSKRSGDQCLSLAASEHS